MNRAASSRHPRATSAATHEQRTFCRAPMSNARSAAPECFPFPFVTAKAPKGGTSKKVYVDVPDSVLFDEHPELGNSQRGKPQGGRVKLCFIMYYDGLEVRRRTDNETHIRTPTLIDPTPHIPQRCPCP